jgi:hypothetical protein
MPCVAYMMCNNTSYPVQHIPSLVRLCARHSVARRRTSRHYFNAEVTGCTMQGYARLRQPCFFFFFLSQSLLPGRAMPYVRQITCDASVPVSILSSKLPCPIPLAAFLYPPILPTLCKCRGAHVVVVDRARMRVMCRKRSRRFAFPVPGLPLYGLPRSESFQPPRCRSSRGCALALRAGLVCSRLASGSSLLTRLPFGLLSRVLRSIRRLRSS